MNNVFNSLDGKLLLALGAVLLTVHAHAETEKSAQTLAGFRASPFWGEQVRMEKTTDGVRVLLNAPARMDAGRPTLLVVYATPNGNTIEQTMGCERRTGKPEMDWHYDIQHVAAQTRLLRERDKGHNIVLAVVEAEGRSWPAWKQKRPDGPARILALVTNLRKKLPGNPRVALTGHSGGGSFLFGVLDAADAIPEWVDRIAFLDANYSYSNEAKHGDKLLAWLRGEPGKHLVVLAYDDRNITLDGKRVVGPDGGTFRATHRMIDRFRNDVPLAESRAGNLDRRSGLDGQIRFSIDLNPENRILHTVLVETNGFLHAMTVGTPQEKGVSYRGTRAYAKWVQPCEPEAPVGDRAARFPARPPDATTGTEVMRRVAHLSLAAREDALLAEVARGNVPDALRTFQVIEVASVDARGRRHTGRIAVAPDVLSIGSDADYVRVPLTPMAAVRVGKMVGCALPTRRLSDAIHRAAETKLEPRPLTVDRESVATFLQHNATIEGQRGKTAPGRLVAGHKKDVVLTSALAGKPDRVAIYGWHYPDGTPIQPLYTGHVATYVDYSHGIRLVARAMTVDGREMDYYDVLRDPDLCGLLSDEGPIPWPETHG